MTKKSAEVFLSEGNYTAAIDSLSDDNRCSPKPSLEQKLADLRVRAFREHRHCQGPKSWPPPYHSIFGHRGEIPEITHEELDVCTLASGILDHGSLIVRNLISNEQAYHLTQDIDQVIEAQQAFTEGAPVGQLSPWFSPPDELKETLKRKRKFTSMTSGACAVDSPRAMFRIFELYRRLGLRKLLYDYFGEMPCVAGSKWVLRRMPPQLQENDWHQDGSFMGSNARSVNVWIALTHCGGTHDTAGIELIPKRLDHIVPTGTDGAWLSWTVSPEYVRREFTDPEPVSPSFAPGDAILFDHFNLHRTACSPSMQKNRYAIECWFFAASRYGQKQIPLWF